MGDRHFYESVLRGRPPRFQKMGEIEERYLSGDLTRPETRKSAKEEILRVVNDYRAKEE